MYPHFFDGAKKRWYPPKKRFPTPAVCSRKRCPLHKGTKTLHRENGDSDSRPPSFRPTAVFILHLPPGCFRLNLAGWDYNPSVICFANATSLCTREAALRVTWESLFRLFCNKLQKIHLLLSRRRQTPLSSSRTSPLTGESPLGRLIASAECGEGIPL